MEEVKTGGVMSTDIIGEVNGALPSIVKKAVHNLSLDDGRNKRSATELPEILDNPLDAVVYPPMYMDSQNDKVHEVYFPGVHEDVGGSEEVHGLSDCAGVYMKEWLESEGIQFYDTANDIPEDHFVIPDWVNKGAEGLPPVQPDDVAFNPNPGKRDYHNDGRLRDDSR